MLIESAEKLDAIIEPMLHTARIPGAAIAIVVGDRTVFAKGYGYRDLRARLPMTSDTIYPIGSTTKAINATLLGMLVDAGRLAWDVPVQSYLPGFRLSNPLISAQVTVRDLITMRTGLPRHDWMWMGNPISRAELVERLRYLESSSGFRERFQYNNLTVTAAGYLAEIVTGESWEALVREKLLEPLGMRSSQLGVPNTGNVTLSYHETTDRELILSARLATEVAAPAGGALHCTVEDMARWIAFNLSGGSVQGRQLIQPQTLKEICSPQMVVGKDPTAPSPGAAYAMGWFVDKYNGCARVSHGGYLRDINSEVTLFPEHNIGIVSTTNFGCPRLARLINQQAFDLLQGLESVQTLQEKLAQYEKGIEETRQRRAAVHRVAGTLPSHPLDAYAGRYAHAAYGTIEIQCHGQELALLRAGLVLVLQHWHYDAWIVGNDEICAIHEPHPFDRASRLLFESNADGEITGVSIRLEPSVAAIRFERR